MERASCVFVRFRLGTAMTDVTRILNAIEQGDAKAAASWVAVHVIHTDEEHMIAKMVCSAVGLPGG